MYIIFNKYSIWVLCAIFVFLLSGRGWSQSSDTIYLSEIPAISWQGETSYVTADHLGHLYAITAKNEIEKYNESGRLLARYSNNRLGTADYLDVSNPLKIIVFYKNFRTIEWLDRNLTLLGKLHLEEVGLPMVNLVASARDGHVWVYDEVNFKLKKITANGTVLFESQPLQFLPAPPYRSLFLQEWDESVFLWEAGRVFQFDAYAQWRGVFSAILPSSWGAVAGKNVSFFEANRLIFVQNYDTVISERRVVFPFPTEKMQVSRIGKYLVGKISGQNFAWRLP